MLILCMPVPVLYWELDLQDHGNQASFSGLGPLGAAANKDALAEFTVVGWLVDQDRVADATSGNAAEERRTNHVANEERSAGPFRLAPFPGESTPPVQ